MSARAEVAKAIYTAATNRYPGRPLITWEELSAASLEYWGGLADAAMGACQSSMSESEHVQSPVTPIEGLAQALGLPQQVEDVLKCFPLDETGHVSACGYDAPDQNFNPRRTCACGTLPRRIAAVLG